MIQIKPDLPQLAGLPEALHNAAVEGIEFTGVHTLVRLQDYVTQTTYYHTLPTGHAAQFPVTFSSDGEEKYHSVAAEVWMAAPLINSVLHELTIYPPIEKTQLHSCSKVIILNCLDDCYGHCLYKLFNAQQHLDNNSDFGLVIIVPRLLKWLVPSGVAEIWSVDAPLNQLSSWVKSLDDVIKKELSRFQQAYLSLAIMELDLSTIDIRRFVEIEPLQLNNGKKTPKQVTFICREDRFWLSTKLDQLLYLLSRKFRWERFFKSYFVRKQNHKFDRVAHWLTKRDASITCTAVGLGTWGSLGELIKDQRVEKITSEEIERQWCQLYARSHVVVGVHGSNMLLPTAFAAGFINLLPNFKEPHRGEDVFPRSGKSESELERFLPTETSSSTVAKHTWEVIHSVSTYEIY
ncbi:MAG: hypothetical protein AAF944_22040 [Bacteroidota bacterium]